ncbi:LPXTG cell wall anchor domain-containing protein [Secundilactobacillus paracollinoides]|uniref:LPXTG cell wall anchor domain-containing protein n=1 Tax=Secundilactobacillus paracollinoides TaxID=240427 RepID=UPI001CDAFDDF|nr:LPXTG cell wall anchor domain-containing protein [Secundilactobacillus paracollinoides]
MTYVVPGDPSAAPKTVTQDITWKVVRDMVTGSSYATAQNGYDEVDTPTLVGYTADKSSVAQVLFGNEPTSDLADSTVVVTYTANPVAPDNGGNGGNDSDGGTPTTTGTDSSTPGNDTATDNDGDTVSGNDNGKSGDSGDTTTSSSSHGDTVTHGQANENSSVATTAKGDTTTGKQETTNRTLSGTLTTSSADTGGDKSVTGTADKTSKLPQTSEQQSGVWAIVGASLMGLLGLIGFGKKKREDD